MTKRASAGKIVDGCSSRKRIGPNYIKTEAKKQCEEVLSVLGDLAPDLHFVNYIIALLRVKTSARGGFATVPSHLTGGGQIAKASSARLLLLSA